MGSTQVGRSLGNAGGWIADRAGIGGTAKDMLKDPGRIVNMAATGGISEIGMAAEQKYLIDPRQKGEALANKQEAEANAMIDKQQSEMKQQDMIKNRDLARARQRAMMSNSGGRSSTILTQPGMYTGASSNGYVSGRKQLLGM